jgi:hypothetical protein
MNRVQFKINALHIYAHKKECQSRFSSRDTEGVGLTAGEIIETMWSQIGPAGSYLREMTKASRRNFISIILSSYASNIIHELNDSLMDRLETAITSCHEFEKRCYELIRTCPNEPSLSRFYQKIKDKLTLREQQQDLSRPSTSNNDSSLKFTNEHINLYLKLQVTPEGQEKTILRNALNELENKPGVTKINENDPEFRHHSRPIVDNMLDLQLKAIEDVAVSYFVLFHAKERQCKFCLPLTCSFYEN